MGSPIRFRWFLSSLCQCGFCSSLGGSKTVTVLTFPFSLSYHVDIAVQDSSQVSRTIVATYSDRRLCTDFIREEEGVKFQAYLIPWEASTPDHGNGRFNIVKTFKTSGYCRNLESRRTWHASCGTTRWYLDLVISYGVGVWLYIEV